MKSGHFLFLLGKVEEEEAWLGGLTESQGRTEQLFKEEAIFSFGKSSFGHRNGSLARSAAVKKPFGEQGGGNSRNHLAISVYSMLCY